MKGYQPDENNLDPNDPPKGGSGVKPPYITFYWGKDNKDIKSLYSGVSNRNVIDVLYFLLEVVIQTDPMIKDVIVADVNKMYNIVVNKDTIN